MLQTPSLARGLERGRSLSNNARGVAMHKVSQSRRGNSGGCAEVCSATEHKLAEHPIIFFRPNIALSGLLAKGVHSTVKLALICHPVIFGHGHIFQCGKGTDSAFVILGLDLLGNVSDSRADFR